MRRHRWRLFAALLLVVTCEAQTPGIPAGPLSWQEVVNVFRANNPTLIAGRQSIDEAKADEITAFLRPNPDLNIVADDLGLFSYQPFQPTANGIFAGSVDYLHERGHKRELRLADAQAATAIAVSTQADLERTMLYSLRDAFNRVLLAKAILQVADENLQYYDKEIEINRQRLNAGDMARVDFQRVELQRTQYESDLANAAVNLRTAKIDLLQYLHTPIPVDKLDLSGKFDYDELSASLPQLRDMAVAQRPDLKEAQEGLERAQTDYKLAVANGTADPTWSVDVGRQPPLTFYAGISVSIPLRIFDRNQGEKLHTKIDISRNRQLVDAQTDTVFHDVDSAYATVQSTLVLLRPYKQKYLKEASDVRETISFSYLHGAASLLDFLDAQKEYRDTELNYLNLVGTYLSAANQLNLAVGREVIQ